MSVDACQTAQGRFCDAGEFVVECFTADGETYPHVGSQAVGERVVRCRDCERFSVDQSDHEYRSGWWCKRWDTDMVKPDGFCAWGERRAE